MALCNGYPLSRRVLVFIRFKKEAIKMIRIGINHPVVKVPTYKKMSVTTEEFQIILAHRKVIREQEETPYRMREISIEARRAALKYRRDHGTS